MPSSYSVRARFTLQASGENLNTWGAILNSGVFQLIEDAIAKRVAFTLSGTRTLTAVNGSADEARCAFLDITGGTGGTIIIPSVEKIYLVRNGSTGDVIVSTGGATTATVGSGDLVNVVCDATTVRRANTTEFQGVRLKNIGAPTVNTDAATKKYVDDTAFSSAGGTLPGQGGNDGKFMTTNGTVASWETILQSNVSGLVVTLATQLQTSTDLAVAFATIL